MAERIRSHFGTHRFRNVVGGVGIEVTFHGALDSGAPAPFTVNWRAGCPIAVVAMIDLSFAENAEWVAHLRELGQRALKQGTRVHLLPVVMESSVSLNELALDQQALRWDKWDSTNESCEQRLIRELAYEFARILRDHLHTFCEPNGDQPGLGYRLEKIQTFLSHTKQDGDGREISEAIRRWLYQNSALSSFLDIYDIPVGSSFSDVINHNIGKSIFLAILTDHYSSREWCRREVIEAKRKGVPMIVVDCLRIGDERAFPYLGNVPVVRMDPVTKDRIPEVVGRLLDEILVDFLWRCRVRMLPEPPANTVFMTRPPELLSLAYLAIEPGMREVVVYPDPPLGQEEMDVFSSTWGDLRIQTLTQWLAEEVI